MAALTITMQSDDEAVRAACIATAHQVLEAMAAKYGFDAEAEARALNLDQIKIQRKRGAPAKKPVTKKTKAPDGLPKPKRALTGYLKYAASVRSEVKAALLEDLEDGGKLQPQAVVSAIAARWKAETEELRAAWNKDAKSASSDSDPEGEFEVVESTSE